MDAVSAVPVPVNEPVRSYAPGSSERASLEATLKELGSAPPVDLTLTIAGEEVAGEGEPMPVVQPHRHAAVLGHTWDATPAQVSARGRRRARGRASLASAELRRPRRGVPEGGGPARRSVARHRQRGDHARAVEDLLPGGDRRGLRARRLLAVQRPLRAGILAEQPQSAAGVWNRFDHRPLEGFVLAITPFNFTSIAGNLPTAPALMGVPVVWKPSQTQGFSAHVLMRLLEAAGLPPGVINLVTGNGRAVSEVALVHPDLAGVHFTGSTPTFQHLWRTVGDNLTGYRSYPRLVGETGGKDFVIAHPSADVDALRVGLVRGAFEYQGQKCSAASRAYIADSVWRRLRDDLAADVGALPMGDPTDFSNFLGAVIDRRAFDRLSGVLERASSDPELSVFAGGTSDDSEGYFVTPTVLIGTDPTHEVFTTEYFGPILSVYVYDDADFSAVMAQAATATPYALTGAIFAQDRAAVAEASEALRYAAGNFYINDKPTGAVVGQQPFGGARASGTNDKAGSAHNLLRWTSPRVIKETFNPATDWRYPHLG